MDPELFCTQIEDRLIALNNASDVVRFSFIVQPSVSYLDLQLCKNSPFSYYFGRCFRSLDENHRVRKTCVLLCGEDCAKKRPRSYLNTEERCRKFLCPSRDILYTLHLDLAKEREHSLKNVPLSLNCRMFSNSMHVADIEFIKRLEMLSNLIKEAFDRNVSKMNILKMIIEKSPSKFPLLSELPAPIVSEFFQCFYGKDSNCKLFKNFIRHFDIIEWTNEYECPQKMEYLLYSVRRHGNVLLERGHEFYLVTECLFSWHLEKVGPVLKYTPTARLAECDYETYLHRLEDMEYLTKSFVENVEKWMTKDRIHRILQAIFLYMKTFPADTEKEVEALGLVWKSIPDPYVTYGELDMVLGEGFLKVEDVHEFYKQAVGEPCGNLEPRSLKHLCRTVVRNRLWENELWIPEGIKRIPLPKSLQLYLNLDQSLSVPGARVV